MKAPQENVALLFARLLIRPVASFCLRHALKIQELVEAAKTALISVAEEEIIKLGHRPTVGRISVMTGIHRADVARLYKNAGGTKSPQNVITRIIGHWLNASRFITSAGLPRVLSFDGKTGEFAELVHSVSGDLNPYTVLFELERLGAVKRSPRGIRLVTKEYIVKDNLEEAVQHLSQDSDDLLSAVEQNLLEDPKLPNLHLRTAYDNISCSRMEEIRKWLLLEGSAFHEKANLFLGRLDRDVRAEQSTEDQESAVRVVVGSFSRIELLPQAVAEEKGDLKKDER